MKASRFKKSQTETPLLLHQRGQVLVEYLLLMVIAIGFATLLTKSLINREGSAAGNYQKTGIIIKAWDKILQEIATDLPDCVNPDCAP